MRQPLVGHACGGELRAAIVQTWCDNLNRCITTDARVSCREIIPKLDAHATRRLKRGVVCFALIPPPVGATGLTNTSTCDVDARLQAFFTVTGAFAQWVERGQRADGVDAQHAAVCSIDLKLRNIANYHTKL